MSINDFSNWFFVEGGNKNMFIIKKDRSLSCDYTVQDL